MAIHKTKNQLLIFGTLIRDSSLIFTTEIHHCADTMEDPKIFFHIQYGDVVTINSFTMMTRQDVKAYSCSALLCLDQTWFMDLGCLPPRVWENTVVFIFRHF